MVFDYSHDTNPRLWFASLRTKLMKVYSSKDELLALQVNNSSDSTVPLVELANSKEPSAAAVFDISSNESSPLASGGCCSTVNSDLKNLENQFNDCLLYTSPSPRDQRGSRMPSSA